MKLSQTPKMVVGLECVAAISSGELFNIVLMENWSFHFDNFKLNKLLISYVIIKFN